MNAYVTIANGDDTTITTNTGKGVDCFYSLDADHARHQLVIRVAMGVPVDWLDADELLVKYNTRHRVLRAYKYDGVKFNRAPVRVIATAGKFVMEEYFGVFEQVRPAEEGLKLYRNYVQVRRMEDNGTERSSMLKEHDLPQDFIAQTLMLGKIEMEAAIGLRDNENIKEITVTCGDEETFKATRDADGVITQTPFTA